MAAILLHLIPVKLIIISYYYTNNLTVVCLLELNSMNIIIQNPLKHKTMIEQKQ